MSSAQTTKHHLKVLSTGKSHISYSELADWYSCQYKHKLKHIDKISLDVGSIHTIFGQVIHSGLEEQVRFRKGLIDAVHDSSFWAYKFVEDYFCFLIENNLVDGLCHFPSEEEREKILELFGKFKNSFENILQNVLEWLDLNFLEWELIDAEYKIFEPISEELEDISFKGFIDLIIKVPKTVTRKGQVKKVTGKFDYWILDWKTTDWGWRREQKESLLKQIQLLFYKNYFCKRNEVDPQDVKVGWVLAKRSPKKGQLPFELITFPSTKKKIDDAILIARQMISALNLEMYQKNWSECFYCVYRGTNHCTVIPEKKK